MERFEDAVCFFFFLLICLYYFNFNIFLKTFQLNVKKWIFIDFMIFYLFYLLFQIITIKNLFEFISWNIFKHPNRCLTDNLLIVIQILILGKESTIYKQDKQEFIEL